MGVKASTVLLYSEKQNEKDLWLYRGYITILDHKAHLNSLDYMKVAADHLVLKIYSYIPYWISERLLRAYQRIVEDRRVNSLSLSKMKLSSALFGMRTCLPQV